MYEFLLDVDRMLGKVTVKSIRARIHVGTSRGTEADQNKLVTRCSLSKYHRMKQPPRDGIESTMDGEAKEIPGCVFAENPRSIPPAGRRQWLRGVLDASAVFDAVCSLL